VPDRADKRLIQFGVASRRAPPQEERRLGAMQEHGNQDGGVFNCFQ
jgi:hypothetical protein